MDPITVTAAAIGMSINLARIILGVKGAFDSSSTASQTLAELTVEIRLVRASLERVEKVIRNNPETIPILEDDEVFAVSVKGSEALLMCIREEVNGMTRHEGWRLRVTALWNQSKMDGLLTRLQRKETHLGLLLQSLTL
jgi:hypothetical protein